MIGVVLIDFKRAFEMIDGQILKERLEMYSINGKVFDWFSS